MEIESHTPRTCADLKGDGTFGSINKPLIELELDHVVPDELHLMLRVMDVLIDVLIETVLEYDKDLHRLSRCRKSFKPINGPMLNNLLMSRRKCGVSFRWYEKNTGKIEWPSLQGTDKIKLLKQLPKEFGKYHPAEIVKDVEKLWKVTSRT